MAEHQRQGLAALGIFEHLGEEAFSFEHPAGGPPQRDIDRGTCRVDPRLG